MSSVSFARRLLLGGAAGWGLLALLMPKPWDLGVTSLGALDQQLLISQYVSAGVFAAALINLIVCLALAAVASFWAQPMPTDAAAPEPEPLGGKWRALFWLAVLGAVVLGSILRWPMAHSSLWWDEIWTVRHAVVGEMVPNAAAPERLDFHPVRWIQTFWRYNMPTNHVTFSVASRAALTVWRAVADKEPWEFDEFFLRLPALLAGLAGIVMIAVLLREWGYPLAGGAGAFLLAVHPWHIRYSCDARCYTILLLLVTVALLLLTRALRHGLWRHWVGYGVTVFLALWSFPYALYLVAFLGLAAIGAILVDGRRGGHAKTQIARLLAANALAAMLLLPMVAPHMLQVRHWSSYAQNEGITRVKSFRRDLWSAIAIGVPHRYGKGDTSDRYPTLESLTKDSRWNFRVVRRLIPALMALGFLALLLRRDPKRWLVLAPAFAAVAAISMAVWTGQFLYLRFVIYALIPVVLLTLIGIESIARFTKRFLPERPRPILAPFLLLLALIGYYEMTRMPRLPLLSRPIAPTREAATFMRDQAGDDPLSVIRAGYLSAGAPAPIYDPWMILLRDPAQVDLYSQEAARQGKPFFICFFDNPTKEKKITKRMQFLLDDPNFKEVARFDGSEPKWTYRVLEYSGPAGAEPVAIPYGNWFVINHDNPDSDEIPVAAE